MTVRKATKYPGVYERIAKTKTFKGKPDIAFDITFRFEGKKIWEKAGWLSEGYSAKLAADVLSERIRAKRHGDELPQQKKKAITFEKLAEKYLKWSAQNKNRAGIEDKSRYENHLKARFDNKRLDEISLFDLERMKAEMSKTKTSTGRPMSPKTIAHCLALLRAMYNKAMDWGLYQGENPIKKKRPGEKKGIMPTVRNTRDRFLSVEEAKLLLSELKRNHQIKKEYKELEDPKLHDIALLSLHTGARAGEIFNLKGQDVDLQNDLITLRDTKNTETRYAPVTKDVKIMLKRRMPDNSNDYIFTDKDGEKIKEVSNAFQRIVDDLGLNDGVEDSRQRVVFHTCRHTFASWLAIQGTPLYTIAKLMGHKSIAMSERYAHLSPDHKKDAVNSMSAIFSKASNQEKKTTVKR
ncbi:MAG: site-specific integrase [Syntrophaceae bacterium]|jgi:integrase|nr:site-specific integrase [Syntrophaceae bacterium]